VIDREPGDIASPGTMAELLREHPALADQIAQIMTERDEQRQQLIEEMQNGNMSDAAQSLLQRMRAFFALD
jgi:hypothetical protein